ncbi:MAG: hypothetical protein ACYC6L_08605 [Anaerolineae bacterium]
MTSPFTQAELDHLLQFIGYGRLDAPVWFLGTEEAGGGEDNLRRRLKFEKVEDCYRAHQVLGITRFHEGKRVLQRTWRSMCYVMQRLAHLPVDPGSLHTYQAERLGRSGGDTLLLELMPLPKPNGGTWDYQALIPQYPSHEAYLAAVKPGRMRLVRNLIREHTPRVVIAYGHRFWDDYLQLLPPQQWPVEGIFRLGRTPGTAVILADHLTARTMNGQLDNLAELARRFYPGV